MIKLWNMLNNKLNYLIVIWVELEYMNPLSKFFLKNVITKEYFY